MLKIKSTHHFTQSDAVTGRNRRASFLSHVNRYNTVITSPINGQAVKPLPIQKDRKWLQTLHHGETFCLWFTQFL